MFDYRKAMHSLPKNGTAQVRFRTEISMVRTEIRMGFLLHTANFEGAVAHHSTCGAAGGVVLYPKIMAGQL